MEICPACHNPLPDNSRFCPNCGVDQAIAPASDLVQTISVPPAKPAPESLGSSDRFIPGAMKFSRLQFKIAVDPAQPMSNNPRTFNF